MTKSDWTQVFDAEQAKAYWSELSDFVAAERASADVYPPPDTQFAAFNLTALADVKVVILGQDPYHGPGQATGLSFSVSPTTAIPRSLSNVFEELVTDIGVVAPANGSLEPWARQGVLLLNTSLTVRHGEAGSHQGRGWETFTDEIIRTVNKKTDRVVFLLWGKPARAKCSFIDLDRHAVVESVHPSPLSAYRGFFGSRPFSRANRLLAEGGRGPIDWALPGESTLFEVKATD